MSELNEQQGAQGESTYWERPGSRSRERKGRSNSPNSSSQNKPANLKFDAHSTRRQPSPPNIRKSISPTTQRTMSQMKLQQTQEEINDEKDEKAIVKLMKSTLPKFSDQRDWEVAMFELSLVLDRVWPYKDQMDILKYMDDERKWTTYPPGLEIRADRIIYFALTLSAEKDSYAKLQIVASCTANAVPSVMKNEGKKLYQMFKSLFTMATLHQATLPIVRKQFHAIKMNDNESVLKYTSRVDILVATLEKLGERVSTSAWIYAMGNGLPQKFKDSKEGVLYSKHGYHTVMEVKAHLLSEEAILTSSNETAQEQISKENENEIALKIANNPDTSKELALYSNKKGGKSKGNKGKGKGGNRNWNQENNWQNKTNNWQQNGKGKSNANNGNSLQKTSWCDICQKDSHTTEICYKNPNRVGGIQPNSYWCDIHQAYGHSTDYCPENGFNKANQWQQPQKGQPNKGTKGKGKGSKGGNRNIKGQNFPSDYSAEQASSAVHQETPTTTNGEWWNNVELASFHKDNATDTAFTATESERAANLSPEQAEDERLAYVDLFIIAIIKQIDRYQAYTIEPTLEGANEINEHDLYITNAETDLDEQSIIELNQFKNLIRYNEQRTQMITKLRKDSDKAMPNSSAMLISKTERNDDSDNAMPNF